MLHRLLVTVILPLFSIVATAERSAESDYLVGRAIADITGPAAGVNMWGFAREDQQTAGIHFRQFVRTFVIADVSSDARIAFVTADLGSTPHEIQREVVDRLERDHGDLYTLANVIVSATHTHSGPGGYWHYGLNTPLGGAFHHEYWEVIVSAIVDTIRRAHEDLVPARIQLGKGIVENAGAQRSAEAYLNNPDAERTRYDADTDKEMTQLTFVTDSGPIGLLNWFPVHPTAMTYNNHLISGDHKGHASALFEKRQGDAFVAAFANSNCGDVTPNLNLDNTGPGENEFETTRIIAERQFEVAEQLFNQPGTNVTGPIDYRQTYVNFSNLRVGDEFTGAGEQHTCPSAYGYAFAAGSTEDGGGHPMFREGMKEQMPMIDGLVKQQFGFDLPDEAFRQCQAPKAILFATGLADPPMQAQILPLTLIRLGQVALVCVPGEITTMAGRRLRDTVARELGDWVSHVVIAAYSNDYGGYITTKEEYDTQQYEGGHTLYGPWQLAGYQQEFAKLARALRDGEPVTAPEVPRDLRGDVPGTALGTEFDAVAEGHQFGDVVENAAESYQPGDTVRVTFWTGHPQNGFRPGDNFMSVQRHIGDTWQTVATDNDWTTAFAWSGHDEVEKASHATLTWTIPKDTPGGRYRMLHHGRYKESANGAVHSFEGVSAEFNVSR